MRGQELDFLEEPTKLRVHFNGGFLDGGRFGRMGSCAARYKVWRRGVF